MKCVKIFAVMAAVVVGTLAQTSVSSLAQNAPSPEALQAAKDLVSVISSTTISDMSSKMVAQVWPSIETALRTQNPKLDAATLADMRAEYEWIMVTNITLAMNDAPPIYARYFTAQEMRDIMAFYRSPAGAKTLKTMPEITASITALMTTRLQGLQEKVNLAFLNVMQRHGLYAQ